MHSAGGVDVITDSMARDVVIPIPDSVLRRLPTVIQEFLATFPDPYSRTTALLSLLVCSSCAFVNYENMHDHKHLGPALMLFVYGEGGQGKGVMAHVSKLLDDINCRIEEEAVNQKRKHDLLVDNYNINLRRKMADLNEERAADDIEGLPERVPAFYPRQLKLGKLTCAALEKLMIGAGQYPVLIFSTEAKTIVTANGSRAFGGFMDLVNKGAMEEEVIKDLSTESEHMRNPQPRLAALISGVPDDLPAFFGNGTSDGMPSRFLLFGIPTWSYAYDDPTDEENAHDEEVFAHMKELLNGAYDTLITHTDKPMRLHFSPTQHCDYNWLMRKRKEEWLNLSPSSDISAMANRQRMLFRRLCMNLQVWKQMDVDGTFIFPDDGRLMLDDDVFDVCMELVNYNAKQHIFAYDRYLRFSQQQPATEDNSESQRLFRMLPDGIDLSISKVLEFADKNGFKLTKRTIQRWFAKWSSGEDRWLTITEVNGRELIYRKAHARA